MYKVKAQPFTRQGAHVFNGSSGNVTTQPGSTPPASPPPMLSKTYAPPIGGTRYLRQSDGYDSYMLYRRAVARDELIPYNLELFSFKCRVTKYAHMYVWHRRVDGPRLIDYVQEATGPVVRRSPSGQEGVYYPTVGHVKGEERADNIALSNFHSNLSSTVTKLMGIVESRELGKTSNLAKGAANAGLTALKGIMSGYKQLRRDVAKAYKRTSGKELRNRLSGLYLQYTYGVKPLFYTVEGAKHILLNPPTRTRERVVGFARIEESGPYTGSQPVGVVQYDQFDYSVTAREVRETVYKYQGNIWFDDRELSLVNKLGFNPIDLLPALWELLPFSFLADYVANFGDVITAVSNSLKVQDGVYSSTVFRKRTIEEDFQASHRHRTDGAQVLASTLSAEMRGKTRSEYVYMNRRRIGAPGIPTLGLNLFDNSFTNKLYALNALVLAESFVTRSASKGKRLDSQSREAIRKTLLTIPTNR